MSGATPEQGAIETWLRLVPGLAGGRADLASSEGADASRSPEAERGASATSLKTAEDLLAAIFLCSHDWISVVGADDHLVAVSRAGLDLLHGAGAGEVLGRRWDDLFPPADRAAARAALETARRAQPATFETAMGATDPPRWWEVTVSALRTREALVIARDVTDRKLKEERAREHAATLEARVHERTLALEAMNRELEAFSYSVSHDLRAPIRHIAGFADLLSRHAGPLLDARGIHYMTTITQAARTAGRLVDDLLAFSRVGRVPLTKTTLDMNALVESCRREIVAEAGGRVVEWKIADLPSIAGDQPTVRMVFKNLLSNAVKYTRKKPAPVIEVTATRDGSGVTFHVKDNGAGFDMKHSSKLFGVFQRLHRADEFEGTGIGLANVKRIVLRHGGTVSAEGAPLLGATFHVTFPDG